ncbi:TPA: MptD family putative ECF transporter S component [Streptococcus pyogenes]|nr:MptD family putative ECF transporter S component [Streptococcus pyogenes]HEP3248052.1 MptD family putative ECF transporter S component [Streptococcus pyogenes]HEP3269053.1 MptD family putative ECF transporter S component [Streptococcus pyogenes]HEP3442649.1 MptD family putative ECF transporter S component [Streptococcus pyogenes]HEP3539206.1 MptD family putative ECF transporter S component [Streptococcus pyogenes]
MDKKENKLQVKDLIMIGVFSALYFVLNMVGGMPFAMNPILTFYQPMGSAFLSGIIFMFLIAKSPKRGTITILSVIMCILRFATGMHWAMGVGTLIAGIIAEIIAGSKSYKNKKMNMLSFGIFALGDIGTFLVYFINPESWSNAMIKKGTDISYIESMNAAAANWMIYVIVIGTFLVALLSAWIGMKLLKKQFEKAGIV